MSYVDEIALRIRNHVDPKALPEQPSDELFRIYAVLVLTVGHSVTISDVHNAWAAWMSGEEPGHESLIPTPELDESVLQSDLPFLNAIREVAAEIGGEFGDDDVLRAMLPNGVPNASDADFLVLYQLMVGTSESLVTRRQGVNTFFLTINGLLVTVIGFFLRGGKGLSHWDAAGIAVVASVGIVATYSWFSLLKSYGQLNAGKFAIINRMERFLPASPFKAEWTALDEGKDRKRYRTFTRLEGLVPLAFAFIYVAAALVGILLATHVLTF
jgi:hypothetical protein